MSELDRQALKELTSYVRGPGPAAIRTYVRKELLAIPPPQDATRSAGIVRYLSALQNQSTPRAKSSGDGELQARWSAWMPEFRKTACGAEPKGLVCSWIGAGNDLQTSIVRSEPIVQSSPP
jgi:hypothetical protein